MPIFVPNQSDANLRKLTFKLYQIDGVSPITSLSPAAVSAAAPKFRSRR